MGRPSTSNMKLSAGEGFTKDGNYRLASVDKRAFVTPRAGPSSNKKTMKQGSLASSFKKVAVIVSSSSSGSTSRTPSRDTETDSKDKDTPTSIPSKRSFGARILNPSQPRFSSSVSFDETQESFTSEELGSSKRHRKKEKVIPAGRGTLALASAGDGETQEEEEEESSDDFDESFLTDTRSKKRSKKALEFRDHSQRSDTGSDIVIISAPSPSKDVKPQRLADGSFLIEETPSPSTIDEVTPNPSLAPPNYNRRDKNPSLDEIDVSPPEILAPESSPRQSEEEEEEEFVEGQQQLDDSEDDEPSLEMGVNGAADDSGFAEMEMDARKDDDEEDEENETILPQSLKVPSRARLQKRSSSLLEETQFYPRLDQPDPEPVAPEFDEEDESMPPPPPPIVSRPRLLVPDSPEKPAPPPPSYHGFIRYFDNEESQFDETLPPVPPPVRKYTSSSSSTSFKATLNAAWEGQRIEPPIPPKPRQSRLGEFFKNPGEGEKAGQLSEVEKEMVEVMVEDRRRRGVGNASTSMIERAVNGEEEEEILDEMDVIGSSQSQYTPLDHLPPPKRALIQETMEDDPETFEEEQVEASQVEEEEEEDPQTLSFPPSSNPSHRLVAASSQSQSLPQLTQDSDEEEDDDGEEGDQDEEESFIETLRPFPEDDFEMGSFEPLDVDPATQKFEEVFKGVWSDEKKQARASEQIEDEEEEEESVPMPEGVTPEMIEKVRAYDRLLKEKEERKRAKAEQRQGKQVV